jgi:predicted ATPase
VPLFVEELTRALLENSSGPRTADEIPVTLRDSLMARLDRLGPAREVLQIGAAIGKEFSYELLHAIYPIADDDLQKAVRIATDAELVYVQALPLNRAINLSMRLSATPLMRHCSEVDERNCIHG